MPRLPVPHRPATHATAALGIGAGRGSPNPERASDFLAGPRFADRLRLVNENHVRRDTRLLTRHPARLSLPLRHGRGSSNANGSTERQGRSLYPFLVPAGGTGTSCVQRQQAGTLLRLQNETPPCCRTPSRRRSRSRWPATYHGLFAAFSDERDLRSRRPTTNSANAPAMTLVTMIHVKPESHESVCETQSPNQPAPANAQA
jgi:hypothetical protein